MPPNSSELLDKSRTLLEIIAQFTESFNSAFGLESDDFETTELKPGARISHIFCENLAADMEKLDPVDGLSEEKLLIAIKNSSALRPTIFISERSFELLAKHQIRQLERPSLHCVKLVYLELLRVVRKCGDIQGSVRSQFPILFDRIDEIVSELLIDRLRLTEQFVADLMEIETAYVNCKNPDFIELVQTVVWEDRPSAKCYAGDQRYAPVTNLPPPSLYFEQQFQKYQAVSSFPSWKFGFFKQISKMVTSSIAMAGSYPALPATSFTDNQDKALLASEDMCIEDVSGKEVMDMEMVLLLEDAFKAQDGLNSFESREKQACFVTKKLISCYFLMVRKNVQDMVPKSIMKFLVDYVKDNLQNQLIQELYASADLGYLFGENEQVDHRAENEADDWIGEI